MKPLVFLAVFGLCTAALADTAAAPRPNVIVILADDLGYGSIGTYGANPHLVRTPNLDRLAAAGVRFTDATAAASICSPSRYALLTGRYCWRTPLKFGVLKVESPLHIETTRPTLATLFKQAGYATAAVGKWHLGYGSQPPDYTGSLKPGPLEVGFDYHFGVPSNHGDGTGVYIENHGVYGLRSTELRPFGQQFYGPKPWMGLDAPQRVDQEVPTMLVDKALAWLDRQSGPFFLYFNPVEAHEPVSPSAAVRGTSAAGPYGEWIHELDRSVGRILEWLERTGKARDTLVVFTSDNGGENKKTRGGEEIHAIHAGLALNGVWHAGKHSIYEGGLRVPFIVSWPARIPAGRTSDATLCLVDLPATFAALLGQSLPAPDAAFEDSHNRLPAFFAEATPARPFVVHQSADGVISVRDGAWKWVEGTPTNPKPWTDRRQFSPQLYNLARDPEEQFNVLDRHPEVAARLAALLQKTREAGRSRDLSPAS